MEATVSKGRPPLPDHLHAPYLHAGFWRRFAALIIDSFILTAAAIVVYMVLAVIVMVPAGAMGRHESGALVGLVVLFYLVVIIGQWLYFALFESGRWQATPGKLALGLRVTDLYGQRIGFGRATGRFFGKILSGMIFDIGFMLAGWTAHKQALHDLIASCCVVRKDGLEMFEQGESPDAARLRAAGTGMPGWAIALVVAGAIFFMVIPTVAILAAIAIPAYQDYLVRAQVSEGVVLAAEAKTAVDQYVGNTGQVPHDNDAVGLAEASLLNGQYVSSVEVKDGSVVVTYGGKANDAIAGDHLVFQPYGSRDEVQWRCSSPDIKVQYLPTTCRE